MSEKTKPSPDLEKLVTGIPGFEHISKGGLPKGRTTLVSGSSGSAKTVFACQFLAQGIKRFNEPGVFVTFEESPEDIMKNMESLGWDLRTWQEEGKWAFVDISPQLGEDVSVVGEYDLGALLARIEHAINKTGAKRVSMDSLGALFDRFDQHAIIRTELFRIVSALRKLNVTTIVTAERAEEYGSVSRHGVEEFVADNVIILRNVLEEEKRRRTLEILKFRGTSHQKGEFPFSVMSQSGIVIIPISAVELVQESSDVRIHTGNAVLDEMTGGGYFQNSIILVSGATGCGKTLMTTEFINGGFQRGGRCLLFAYEESREQLFRNAAGWGVDYKKMEQQGKLKVICEYPEIDNLEEHLIRMRSVIEEFQPERLAMDSLSAMERISTVKSFREFVIGLSSLIKERQTVALFTSTTPSLMGGESITEAHISTLTDSIILLRYVEMYGEMRRGLMVLKMRGSAHDKDIREFSIDQTGMTIGEAYRNVSGILSGQPVHATSREIDRLKNLFQE